MSNPSTNKNLVKIGQAAKILGVSIDTLRRWEKAGKIESLRTPGGTRLYSLESLQQINPSTPSINFQTPEEFNPNSTEEILKRVNESKESMSQSHSDSLTLGHPVTNDSLKLDPSSFYAPSKASNTLFALKVFKFINQTISKTIITGLVLGTFVVIVGAGLVAWMTASYLTNPQETHQFLKSNVASKYVAPFEKLSEKALAFIDPTQAAKLGFITLPAESKPLPIAQADIESIRKINSNILGVTTAAKYLEVNADTQINGSLDTTGLINGTNLESTPSANTIAISSGNTQLTVSKSANLDQDVSTTSSPSFVGTNSQTINLTAAKNQITFTNGGNVSALTWVFTDKRTLTLPDATDTLIGRATTDTLTNKSISGSDNTLTNIPNSALTNPQVTVTAGTNLTGGGAVALGSAITLSLKDSPSIAGTLTVSGATTLASTSLSIGGVAYTFPTTQGGASNLLLNDGSGNLSWNSLAVASGWTVNNPYTYLTAQNNNVGIGTDAPQSKLGVSGNLAVGVSYGSLAAPPSGAIIEGNVGIGTSSPNYKLQLQGDLSLSGNIYPQAANSQQIGSSSNYFSDIYVTTLHSTNIAGNVTGGSTTSSDWLINSANNSDAANSSVSFQRATTNAVMQWYGNNNTFDFNSGARLGFNQGSESTIENSVGLVFGGFATDITTGTNENLAIIPNGTGNVGIGTSNPTAYLDVAGTAHFSGNTGIGSSLTVASGANFQSSVNVSGNTQLSTLNTSGNVGVGGTATFNSLISGLSGLNINGSSNLQSLTATSIFANSLTTTGNVGVGGSITGFGALNGLNVTGLSNLGSLNATNINSQSLTTSGNVAVGSSLTVSSGANFQSSVNVTGNTQVNTLNSSGNVGIGGTATFSSLILGQSGLTVNGSTNLQNLTATNGFFTSLTTTGNVGVGGSITGFGALNGLNVTGLTNLSTLNATNINSQTLTTSGNVAVGSSLTVSSAANLDSLQVTKSISGQTLGISGTSNLSGNVGIGSSASVTSQLTAGSILDNGGLVVSGGSYFNTLNTTGNVGIGSSLQVSSGVNFLSSLNVAGNSQFSTLNTSGNIGVGATATFNSLIQGLSGLTITGSANLQALTATNAFLSTLNTTGNVGVGGSLTTTSAGVFNSSLQVSGNTQLSTLTTSGNVGVGGSLTGFANLSGLNVSGATTLASLGVSGQATFSTNLDTSSTTFNIGASATTLNLAGGSSSTGCTVDGSGNFACTGNITGASTGTQGYISRSSGVIYPSTRSDSFGTFSGNIGIGTTAPASQLDLNATTVTGNVANISYGANQSLTGDIIGLNIDLDSGKLTTNNHSVTGLAVTLPTVTDSNSSGTVNIKGFSFGFGTGSGINQTAAGSTVYSGVSLTLPALTQTSGSLTANGVDITTSSQITTGGTANGVNINPTGVGAGNLNGLNIGAISSPGAGTETAIKIGTGWDNGLIIGSTTVINGSGVTQVAGGGTGIASYNTGDILYASGATTLSNLGIGSSGQVLTVTAGVPVWSNISGSSCTTCLVNNPSSTAVNTVAPTGASTTGLIVKQTSTASPSNDIFDVTDSTGTTKYFYVDKNGNVSTGSVSNTNITLTPTNDSTALTLVGTNVATQKLAYFNAANTSGTIFDLSYGTQKTLTSSLTGLSVNFTNLGVGASNQSVTGTSVTLPAVTNSGAGTYNYYGSSLSAAGGINQTGSGTTTYSLENITIPALTQSAGTLTGNGVSVTTPSSITTGGTANGINISASGIAAGNLNGINISGITAGSGAETGIKIGSGWDNAISSPNFTVSGTGFVGIGSSLNVSGNVGIGGTLNVSSISRFSGDLIPTSDATFNLGGPNNRWNTLYLNGSIVGGGSISSGTLHTGGVVYSSSGTLVDTVSQFYFDSTNNRLGIGTSAPTQKLSVAGNIKADGANNGNIADLILTRTDTSWSINNETTLRFYYGTGNTDSPSNVGLALSNTGNLGLGGISSPTTARLQILGSGTSTAPTLMTQNSTQSNFGLAVLDNGNVGIGTTNPSFPFQVTGASGAAFGNSGTNTADQTIIDNSGGARIYQFNSSAALTNLIQTNGSSYLNGGNVGIGFTSPIAKLEVDSSTVNDGVYINGVGTQPRLSFNAGGASADNRLWDFIPQTSGVLIARVLNDAQNSASNWLQVTRSGASITNVAFPNGNVGIGFTSPSSKLFVDGGQITGNAGIIAQNANLGDESQLKVLGTNGNWNPGILFGGTNTTDTANLKMLMGTGDLRYAYASNGSNYVDLFTIKGNGNVGVGTTNPAQKLDVAGIINSSTELRLGNNSFTRVATLDSGGGFGGGYNFNWNGISQASPSYDSTGSLAGIGYSNGGTIKFYTGNSQSAGTAASERARFDTNGSLNIGYAGSAASGLLSINGNVGIGTSNPVVALQSIGSTSIDSMPIAAAFGSDSSHRVNIGYNAANDYGEISAVNSGSSWKNLVLQRQGGSVGVGGAPTNKFTVVGDTTWNSVNTFPLVAESSTNSNLRIMLGYDNTADTGVIQTVNQNVTFNKNLSINPNGGNVGLGTVTPVAQLDQRNTVSGTTLSTYLSSAGGQFGILGNGNVGIGTTNPANKLDVNGNIGLSNGTSNTIFFGTNGVAGPGNNSAGEKISLYGTSGTVNNSDYALGIESSNMWFNTNSGFKWYSASNLKMNMDANGSLNIGYAGGAAASGLLSVNGNVGIGTSNPSSLLDLSSSSAGAIGPTITLQNPAGSALDQAAIDFKDGTVRTRLDFNIRSGGAGEFVFLNGTGGSLVERMRLNGDGNLGVGTSLPVGLFQVGASASNPAFVVTSATGNVGIGFTSPETKFQVYSGTARFGQSTSNEIDITSGSNIAHRWTGDPAGNNRFLLGSNVANDITYMNVPSSYADGGDLSLCSSGALCALQFNAAGTLIQVTGKQYRTMLDTAGNLGIGGTAANLARLQVMGTGASTGITFLTRGLNTSSGPFGLAALDNGNVGIGTTAPQALLDINGSLSSGSTALILRNGDNSVGATKDVQITFGYNGSTNYASYIHTRHNAGLVSGNAIDFYVGDGTAAGVFPNNAVQNLTLNGGNVGIGTTGPGSKLDISGKVDSTSGTAQLVNLSPTFTNTTNGNIANGLNISATDSTTNNSATDYGINTLVNLTGNATKTAYGIWGETDSSSTAADSLTGVNGQVSVTGALASGTRTVYGVSSFPTVGAANASGSVTNLYGVYSNPSTTSSLSGSTVNIYGGFFSPNANSAGTVNNYGVYIDNNGGRSSQNIYGLYVTDQGASNYGVYVAGNVNGKNYFGGNVGIGNASPSNPLDVEANLASAYVGYIYNSNTGSGAASGLDIKLNTGSGTGTVLRAYANDGTFAGNTISAFGYANSSNYNLLATYYNAGGSYGTTNPALIVKGNGNVGIGTSSPLATLAIDQSTTNTQTTEPHLVDFLSNSVATGMTNRAPTNAFGFINMAASTGGLYIEGINTQGNLTPAIEFHGGATGDTTKSTAGRGIFEFDSYLSFPSGGATTTSNANIFEIRRNGSTRDIFDDIGGLYQINPGVSANYIGAGNVGIGTTNPQNPLHVASTATGTNDVLRLQYGGNIGDGGVLVFGNSGTNRSATIQVTSDSGTATSMRFSTFASGVFGERMRIDSGGNVGIGTTNPSSPLTVKGAGGGSTGLTVIDGTNTAQFFVGSSGGLTAGHIGTSNNIPLAFFTNNSSPLMTLSTGGNLGIGFTSPTTKLEVNGTIRATGQTVPTAGVGTELTWDGNQGNLLAYNRGTSAYQPLDIDASKLILNSNSNGTVQFGGTNYSSKTNGVLYLSDSSGTVAATATGGAGTLCLTSASGAAPTWGSCSGSASTSWSNLSSPSANLTLSMGSFNTQFNTTGRNATFYIDATNGNIGIGTSNPGQFLDVYSSTGAGVIQINGAGDAWTYFANQGTLKAYAGYRNNISRYTIGVNGSDRVSIDTNGNVGIGTTNPTSTLEIKSTAASAFTVGPNGATNPAFQIDDSAASAATGIKIASTAAGSNVVLSVLSSNASEGLTILPKVGGGITFGGGSTGAYTFNNPTSFTVTGAGNSIFTGGGNVGIGFTSPAAKLDVYGNGQFTGTQGLFIKAQTSSDTAAVRLYNATPTATAFFAHVSSGNNFFTGTAINDTALGNSISGGSLYLGTTTGSGNVVFKVADTEAMRIDSNGNLGIGFSSPSRPLDVYNNNSMIARFRRPDGANTQINLESGSLAASWGIVDLGRAVMTTVINAAGTGQLQFKTNNAFQMVIDSTGNVGIGTTSPTDVFEVNGPITSTAKMTAARPNSISMSYETSTPIGRIISFGADSSTNGTLKLTSSRSNGSNQIDLLTSDTSGNLKFGGSNYTSKTNGILYVSDSSGSVNATATGGAGTLCLVSTAGGTPTWGACSGSAATAWSSLTAPSTDLTLNMGSHNTRFDTTGATGLFYIDATNGRIGIGTTSPSNPLHISLPAAQLRITNTSAPGGSQSWTLGPLNADGRFAFRDDSSTERLVITQAGNVGIGFSSPTSPLNVVTSGSGASIVATSYGSNPQFVAQKADGTLAAPTAVQNGDQLGNIFFQGFNGSGFTSRKAGIIAGAAENWTTSANGAYLSFETTATGTTSQTERLRIDPSGNIGIGTTNPSSPLTVKGAGGGSTGLTVIDGTNTAQFFVGSSGGLTAGHIGTSNNIPLAFFTNNSSPLMTLSTGGNLGIGTINPGSFLDIVGANTQVSGSNAGGLLFRAMDGNSRPALAAYGNIDGTGFTWNNNAAVKIRQQSSTGWSLETTGAVAVGGQLYSNGNVGIGTTNPGAKLHLFSGSAPVDLLVDSTSTNNPSVSLGQAGTEYAQFYRDNTNGPIYIQTLQSNQPLRLQTTGTTGHILLNPTGTGNVGINTTNPIGLLDVQGTGSTLVLDANGSNTTGQGIYFRNTGNALPYIQYSQNMNFQSSGGVPQITFTTGGNVGIGFTSPIAPLAITTSSDPAFHIEGSASTGAAFHLYATEAGQSKKYAIVSRPADFARPGAFEILDDSSSAVRFSIKTGGNVGIGLPGTTTTIGLCHATNSGATTTIDEIVDCSGTPSDYAEAYGTPNGSEPGDIMVTNSYDPLVTAKSTSAYQQNVVGVISTDPNDFGGNTVPADKNPQPVGLAGRIPVKVSLENGPIHQGDYLTTSSTPGVAMKATKPGVIIGTALEDYDGSVKISPETVIQEQKRLSDHPDLAVYHSDPSTWGLGVGKITVLARVTYADPGNFLASLSLDSEGNLIMPNIKTDKLLLTDNVVVSSNDLTNTLLAYDFGSSTQSTDTNGTTSYTNAAIDVMGSLKSLDTAMQNQKSQVQALADAEATNSAAIAGVSTEVASQSATLASQSSVLDSLKDNIASLSALLASSSATPSSSNLVDPNTLIATGSANLATLSVASDATVSGQLTAYDLKVQNSLSSLGPTSLASTTIAGDLSVDGTLAVENGSEINVIGTLYLQKSGLAQNLDIFNGKVTIDNSGNITSAGTVTASQVKTNQLTISNTPVATGSATLGASIGTATLTAGQTTVTINTTAVNANSKVFVTPISSTDKVLSVTNINNYQSFDVSIPTTSTSDIKFNWWVVGSE